MKFYDKLCFMSGGYALACAFKYAAKGEAWTALFFAAAVVLNWVVGSWKKQ